MKLSDAILLGSTVLVAKPGQYFSETDAGCALGMAAIAKGYKFQRPSAFRLRGNRATRRHYVPVKNRRTLGTEGVWGDWVLNIMARPCQCWRLFVPREMRIKDIIAHLFDRHVMARKNWTLDQLVAWVKTVEPDEVLPPAAMVHSAEPVPEQQEVEEWQRVRQAFEARRPDRVARSSR